MNKTYSILIGIAAGILVGLALHPLIRLAFGALFEFSFSEADPEITKEDIALALIMGAYFFLCCFVAALVCSYFLKSSPLLICRGLSIALSIAVILLFMLDMYRLKFADYFDLIVLLIAINTAFHFGARIIMRTKKSRNI